MSQRQILLCVTALLTGMALSIPLGSSFAGGATLIRHSASTPTQARSGLSASIQPCATGAGNVIGFVGELAQGHSAAELAAEGYIVSPAISGGDPSFVMVSSVDGFPDAQSLAGDPALSASGYLYAQSHNPALTSCDRRLSDSPGAQVYANEGIKAMIADGLVTQVELEEPQTGYLLMDNPLVPGQEIFTVLLAHPGFDAGADLLPIAAQEAPGNSNDITVLHAGVSGLASQKPLCVICVTNTLGVGLTAAGDSTLQLSGGSMAINSNSTDAIDLYGESVISVVGGDVNEIDLVGGFAGKVANISPAPLTGGFPSPDPLSNLPRPTTPETQGTCDPTYACLGTPPAVHWEGPGVLTLSPGVFTTITNTGTGSVVLTPGFYTLTGEGVVNSGAGSISSSAATIFLSCPKSQCARGAKGASISNTGGGSIRLSGPSKTGCTDIDCGYVGIALLSDLNNGNDIRLSGGGAVSIAGTIYVPGMSLIVTGHTTVKLNSGLIVGAISIAGGGVIRDAFTEEANFPGLIEGAGRT